MLTSNRTRELHDALKRRCLYHWIPFPDAARERLILRAYAPGLDDAAADALVEAITRVRAEKLLKRPGIAETIDWAQGASVLAARGRAWPEALKRSLGLLLKEQEDVERAEARARGGAVSARRPRAPARLPALARRRGRAGRRREARRLPARDRALAARRRRRAVLARAGDARRARGGLRDLRRRLRRLVPRRARCSSRSRSRRRRDEERARPRRRTPARRASSRRSSRARAPGCTPARSTFATTRTFPPTTADGHDALAELRRRWRARCRR